MARQKKDKYKIIFDSNILFCDEKDQLDKVFNSYLKDIHKFIKDNKVKGFELCIPQLVIDERVSQRLKQIEDQFNKFNQALKNLDTIKGLNIKEKEFKSDLYRKKLNTSALDLIKKFKIEIIPTVKVDQSVIVERALHKAPPFCGKNGKSDKGFKDTLIWLSLLEDAKNNSKHNFILLTDNKSDFKQDVCQREFEKYSKAELAVIESVTDLKEFLDEKLKLKLELKKLYKKIEQEILSLQGTITSKVGRYLNNDTYQYSGLSGKIVTAASFSLEPEKDQTAEGNLDFHELTIQNILGLEGDTFSVTADLHVKKSKEKNNNSIYEDIFSSLNRRHNDEIIKYRINFEYNKDSKEIVLLAVVKDHFTYPF